MNEIIVATLHQEEPRNFAQIPNSVNYMLRGQKGVHSWHFVLDSRSGNLWVKVWYPGGI